MNLLLIGPRGSGKTTLGRLVAARRGRPFVDLDDLVLAGFPESTVAEVWSARGEDAWRAGEVDALRDLLADDGLVIALGGGTPVIDAARRLIDEQRRRGRARVVYLHVPVATLVERLRARPGDRPSLTGGDVAEEIAAVLAQREATYRAVADAVVDGGGAREHVCAVIERHLGSEPAG